MTCGYFLGLPCSAWAAAHLNSMTKCCISNTDMAPSQKNMDMLQEDFERAVPKELGLERGSKQSRLVAAMMKQYYFPDAKVSKETTMNFVQVCLQC